MRVYNRSDKPYEWTYDGKIWGPVQTGEVLTVPDDVGAHGVNRSAYLDEIGQPTGEYRLVPVSMMAGNKKFEEEAKYPCSICGPEKGIFNRAELETHMMEHFTRPATPSAPVKDEGRANPRLPSR